MTNEESAPKNVLLGQTQMPVGFVGTFDEGFVARERGGRVSRFDSADMKIARGASLLDSSEGRFEVQEKDLAAKANDMLEVSW